MASFQLEACLDRWCYAEGDTVRCQVELGCLQNSTEWIDWLAVQCCGFVHRVSSSKPTAKSPPRAHAGSGTALHDETMFDADCRTCVLSSPPQVVAAGISLYAGEHVR